MVAIERPLACAKLSCDQFKRALAALICRDEKFYYLTRMAPLLVKGFFRITKRIGELSSL